MIYHRDNDKEKMNDPNDLKVSTSESFRSDDNKSDDDSFESSTCSQSKNGLDCDSKDGLSTDHDEFKIVEREDIFVFRMKVIVSLTLVASATALAITIFFITMLGLYDDAMRDFQNACTEILTTTGRTGYLIHHALEVLATTTTGDVLHEAKLRNDSTPNWPYHTITNFQQRVGGFRNWVRVRSIVFSPLVLTNQTDLWNTYSQANKNWIENSLTFQNQTSDPEFLVNSTGTEVTIPVLHGNNSQVVASQSAELYTSPLWQVSPCPTNLSRINYDLLQNGILKEIVYVNEKTDPQHEKIFITSVVNIPSVLRSSVIVESGTDTRFLESSKSRNLENYDSMLLPESFVAHPIYSTFESVSTDESVHSKGDIVGHFLMVIRWNEFFENILPPGLNGIVCVLWNTCGQSFTYDISGPNVTFLGTGDLHDTSLDELDFKRTAPFSDYLIQEGSEIPILQVSSPSSLSTCQYYVSVYPTEKFFDRYPIRSKPILHLTVVFTIFVSTSLVFVLYDYFVTRRQNKILGTAARTHQIVGSLFPQAVREKLLQEQEAGEKGHDHQFSKKNHAHLSGFTSFADYSSKAGLKNFFLDTVYNNNTTTIDESKPIADLFPNTTIMFADISGFAAWSSVREPCQVFTLLETVYHGFDTIARARRVFKVETVGDCYVAVTGLPDPRHDHAVVMARFARDCLAHMNQLVTKLDLTLGPGTEDLTIRVGLHSGPVTAGVLRGERARFQLFGDTMNTAARIETTGMRGKIHISQETADLLAEAHKSNWFEVREDMVVAKGKGVLQTYWLKHSSRSNGSSGRSTGSSGGDYDPSSTGDSNDATGDDANECQVNEPGTTGKTKSATSLDAKKQRLVEWNYELLLQLLKKIVAQRRATVSSVRSNSMSFVDTSIIQELEFEILSKGSCLRDIVEIIEMPSYNASVKGIEIDPNSVDLDAEVLKELHEYVSMLASMYHDNPFHCFEHASHVTMSVTKLLSRIVAPDIVVTKHSDASSTSSSSHHHRSSNEDLAAALHDHTYGITSDPLTQFSVILSGLIHDVDHRGVPNFVLVNEEPSLAMAYNGKSVAEQNSVDIAWRVLMETRFEHLRSCIYQDESELLRFRRLLVNSVMATDIFDKDLGALRKSRWDKAFHQEQTEDTQKQNVDRKATIVIEHLIQASDVAHTMQHWHVYQKWNARLFDEMYKAYMNGRTTKNPAASWYEGELGFFDNYVIPLAKKLKECGVFGVSSDEYLNYALENRREWEKKGKGVVEALLETYSTIPQPYETNSSFLVM